MIQVGVTNNPAFPVEIDVVREVVGSAAEVVSLEVPGWALSPGEENQFIALLEPMTCVLQRPGTFSRHVLESLPKLRHIAVHGAGYDKIDLEAATERGVQVTNAPGANALSVAELVTGLIVVLLRNVIVTANGVAAGKWGEVRKTGYEASGRCLGILGVGHVGSQVAIRAQAMGMRVVAYDPAYTPQEFAARGIEWIPSDEVFASADVLTLHVPLDGTTRHLVNERTLSLMKSGSYLLNLSRGPVVDEAALKGALVSRHIVAAALDVREKEPPPDGDELRNLPNVVLTPHIGGSTDGALKRIAQMCAEEMVRVLSDQPVLWPVNQLATRATT